MRINSRTSARHWLPLGILVAISAACIGPVDELTEEQDGEVSIAGKQLILEATHNVAWSWLNFRTRFADSGTVTWWSDKTAGFATRRPVIHPGQDTLMLKVEQPWPNRNAMVIFHRRFRSKSYFQPLTCLDPGSVVPVLGREHSYQVFEEPVLIDGRARTVQTLQSGRERSFSFRECGITSSDPEIGVFVIPSSDPWWEGWGSPGFAQIGFQYEYALSAICEGGYCGYVFNDWSIQPQAERCDDTHPLNIAAGVLPGDGDGNIVWSECSVNLQGSVRIPTGATLTIGPGVTVRAQPNASLVVDGNLHVLGTSEQPVQFVPAISGTMFNGIEILGREAVVRQAKIQGVNRGIRIGGSASLDRQILLTDLFIEGTHVQNARPVTTIASDVQGNRVVSTGILADADTFVTIQRTLLSRFDVGLHIRSANRVEIVDSIIRDNAIGAVITGGDPVLTQCPPPPAPGSQPAAPVPRPAVRRDPIFRNTDIFQNEGQGMLVAGSNVLLQMSACNVVNNSGVGVEIQGASLDEPSVVVSNNIFWNNSNRNLQLISRHKVGTLDLSTNYMGPPSLSYSTYSGCGGSALFATTAGPVPGAGPRIDTATASPNSISQLLDDSRWR